MKTLKLFPILLALAVSAFAQTTMTQTTTSAVITDTSGTVLNLTSATNVSAQGFILVDREVFQVVGTYVSGTTIPVRRGAASSKVSTHVSGAVAYVVAPGIQARSGFRTYSPAGTCTATAEPILPIVNILTGNLYDCKVGYWGRIMTQFVPPTSCGTSQTTSTATNTYVTVGASAVMVLNSVSNAAAGTTTLVCDFLPPTSFLSQRGAVLYDIVVAVGSQVTAPTSLGTSTLGLVTFPTPSATTQTASTVTPVAAGSTVTTVGPTTTVLTVTTAGAFLTFKHTYANPVVLTTDLQRVHYTFPFLQSAAAAMTLNWPGLWVHYLVAEN